MTGTVLKVPKYVIIEINVITQVIIEILALSLVENSFAIITSD